MSRYAPIPWQGMVLYGTKPVFSSERRWSGLSHIESGKMVMYTGFDPIVPTSWPLTHLLHTHHPMLNWVTWFPVSYDTLVAWTKPPPLQMLHTCPTLCSRHRTPSSSLLHPIWFWLPHVKIDQCWAASLLHPIWFWLPHVKTDQCWAAKWLSATSILLGECQGPRFESCTSGATIPRL